jgi:hypothetical protein
MSAGRLRTAVALAALISTASAASAETLNLRCTETSEWDDSRAVSLAINLAEKRVTETSGAITLTTNDTKINGDVVQWTLHVPATGNGQGYDVYYELSLSKLTGTWEDGDGLDGGELESCTRE